MNIKEFRPKLINFLLALFVVLTVFPVKLNYSSNVIVALVSLSIIWPSKLKWEDFKTRKYLWALSVPLFVYVLGLINTSNLKYGIEFVARNASFLAFPLIFHFLGSKINRSTLIKTFLISIMLVNCYLIYIFIYYFNFGARFYVIVTNDIYHSTYLGMYNLFAFWICIAGYKVNGRTSYGIVALIFIVCAAITSARTIIVLAFLSAFLSIWIIMSSRLKRIGLIVLLVSSFFTIISTVPSIKQKFQDVYELRQLGFDRNNYKSISSRFAKIEAGAQIVKKNLFFGTGTGDLMEELLSEYKRMKFTMGYKYKYNTHNQYLSNLARNGLIGGGISLFFFFVLPFYLSWKKKHLIMGSLILIFAWVSLTECVLDVHKGITFYAFFASLLISMPSFQGKIFHKKEY